MDERFAKNKEEKVVSNKASLDKNTIKKNYAFLALMIGRMVLGAIVGMLFPSFGQTVGNCIYQYDVLRCGAAGVCIHRRVYR